MKRVITKAPDGRIEHRRWYLVFANYLLVCINNIIFDWRQDPHEHSRHFITIVLRGGYTDEQWRVDPDVGRKVIKRDVLRMGSVRFRRSPHVHRVVDVKPNTWTFTIFGPPVFSGDWHYFGPTGTKTTSTEYKKNAKAL